MKKKRKREENTNQQAKEIRKKVKKYDVKDDFISIRFCQRLNSRIKRELTENENKK